LRANSAVDAMSNMPNQAENYILRRLAKRTQQRKHWLIIETCCSR